MSVTSVSNTSLRLLVAEGSEDDYALLLQELHRGGYLVTAVRVASGEMLDRALEEPWDLVISDWTNLGYAGRAVLETLAARRIDTPCIVISRTPGEEAAVEAVRAGALDFLSKDKPRRFAPAVGRALREASDRRARMAAEQELLSEERYRMGFDVMPDPLLTYDLETHTIVDANSKACTFFGCTRQVLCSMTVGALSPPTQPDGRDSIVAATSYISEALAGRSPIFKWMFLVEGVEIPCETRIIHVPTATQALARVSILDLRERIRTEEIRRRSVELELQNRRIHEANRLKSEFLANMSHELRTPLNAIIGFAELLHDGQVEPGTPMHQEFLADILTSGRHLLQLINDVLDLAKVEAGTLDFHPEAVDLTRLVSEVAAILRTLAAHKRLRIETEIDPILDGIFLDPVRFKQLAYNFMSNALKFTPPGGRILVRLSPEGPDQFRFEVTDTGIGISAVDQTRLFVEFQQLDTGVAKRHQGTGLGLALTRRLVEAQQGSVGVRSALGEGSTFFAILPRRIEATSDVPLAPVSVRRQGAQRVLVVEDDPRDRAQLLGVLSGAGYAVELAATGAEALAHWRSHDFDAITIDLLLPDMSGLDLLAALHGEGRKTHVPMIVVTVVPDANVVAGFAVHDILSKPVDRETLLASLVRAGVRGDPEQIE